MATQQQFVQQMVDQLKALDPSISAEIGTPERKIIETVAQAMAETQIDINIANTPFDINSKSGSDIDKLISIFGYGRQVGAKAKGYVTFSKDTAATKDIIIPAGTQLLGPNPSNGAYSVMFLTSSPVTLPAGSTTVIAPIECSTVGTNGNVEANSITNWVGTIVYGITAVTNDMATYGGLDPEMDEELKARFKNTVFRNVSGTMDQFLALGMATAGVTRANVVGPSSRYRERIQIPATDDFSSAYNLIATFPVSYIDTYSGQVYYTAVNHNYSVGEYVNISGASVAGFNGNFKIVAANYDTPQATPIVVSSATGNGSTITYTANNNLVPNQRVTITGVSPSGFNVTDAVVTSANSSQFRISSTFTGTFAAAGNAYGKGQFVVSNSTTGATSAATATRNNQLDHSSYTTAVSSNPYISHFYNDIPYHVMNDDQDFFAPDIDFTVNSPALTLGDAKGMIITSTNYAPNITFNIGPDTTTRKISPGDVLTFDYSYISTASRNNYNKKVLNCIDLFIDTANLVSTDGITSTPYNKFTSATSNSPLYTEKYRRVGNKERRPASGNYFTPLFQQPALDVPSLINVSYTNTTSSAVTNYTYFKGVHYWAVEDVTDLRGTVRSRNGIEWSSSIPGKAAADTGGNYTGPTIASSLSSQNISSTITVNQYTYDKNIQDLQVTADSSKQVTSDVLAHSARVRYLKPDVSVMYVNGSSPANTNQLIKTNLDAYFNSQPFGSFVQLSDILQVIHNTAGVDSVDWTYNQSSDSTLLPLISASNPYYAFKLKETDQFGDPLTTFVIEPNAKDSLRAYFTLYSSSPYLNRNSYPKNAVALSYTPGTTKVSNQLSSSYVISLTHPLFREASTIGQGFVRVLTDALQTLGLVNGSTGYAFTQSNGTDYASSTLYPSYDNPVIIKAASNGSSLPFNAGKVDLTANFSADSYMTSDYDYNSDIALRDDEVAKLPVGKKDSDGNLILSSVITIRQKTQNTWKH